MRKTIGRVATVLLALLVVAAAAAYLVVRSAGHAQVDGNMKLAGLAAPVTVLRDELGVPYIFAANTADLIRVQGFVTSQHRLLQMELFRATWRGELAATFGADALPSDIRMRVLGIARNGERHATRLAPASRALFQHYVDGINAYIGTYPSDHPIELKAAGLVPRPWSVSDLVTLFHYVHYTHSTNFKAEVVAQRLIDKLGFERAREIFPLTVNPDWATPTALAPPSGPARTDWARLDLRWADLAVAPDDLNHQGLGSNNWAVGPSRSASGKAMVSNDPHLDNRILPGTWHPVGLFAPGIQAVGAALPGVPGILVGRTQHVAFGVTNAYGDVQDLYVETVDPADPTHYLDGGRSVPFEVVTENIRIKDKAAPGGLREQVLKVRYTRRGPVVSEHAGLGPGGDKLLVLRSTDAEVLAPVIGIEGLLSAPDVAAFDREVQKIDLMMFNFVFADDKGSIAHRASGAVPIRLGADGGFPRLVPKDGSDDWTGFIPKDRMPGMVDPPRAWVGTANNDTRPEAYPWYYTNYVAPNYRYARIGQVLGAARQMKVDDHWKLMHDDRNLQSDVLRGAIVAALRDDPAQRDLAALLEKWDGVDRAEQAAPLVYQALYREIARATFSDELGDEVVDDMLSTWYFWQQRFDALVARPDSPWFDDVRTPGKRETLADVIRIAAPRARPDRNCAGQEPGRLGLGQGAHAAFREPVAAQRRRPGTAGRIHAAAFGQRRDAEPRRLRFPEALRRQLLRLDATGGGFRRPRQDRGRAGRRRQRAPPAAAPERPGQAVGRRRAPPVVVRPGQGAGQRQVSRGLLALSRARSSCAESLAFSEHGAPGPEVVIPDSLRACHPGLDPSVVIPDSLRDPWIAGAATPDLIRGRNDNAMGIPHPAQRLPCRTRPKGCHPAPDRAAPVPAASGRRAGGALAFGGASPVVRGECVDHHLLRRRDRALRQVPFDRLSANGHSLVIDLEMTDGEIPMVEMAPSPQYKDTLASEPRL